ncbi:MAG: hypothetical protein ACRENZ_05760 [Thermodesulfobacteriota bacterium]
MVKESKNKKKLKEYDFSKGVRGKYAKRYHLSSNLIVLEPDVAQHFPNSESVNQALRTITLLNQKRKVIV